MLGKNVIRIANDYEMEVLALLLINRHFTRVGNREVENWTLK